MITMLLTNEWGAQIISHISEALFQLCIFLWTLNALCVCVRVVVFLCQIF